MFSEELSVQEDKNICQRQSFRNFRKNMQNIISQQTNRNKSANQSDHKQNIKDIKAQDNQENEINSLQAKRNHIKQLKLSQNTTLTNTSLYKKKAVKKQFNFPLYQPHKAQRRQNFLTKNQFASKNKKETFMSSINIDSRFQNSYQNVPTLQNSNFSFLPSKKLSINLPTGYLQIKQQSFEKVTIRSYGRSLSEPQIIQNQDDNPNLWKNNSDSKIQINKQRHVKQILQQSDKKYVKAKLNLMKSENTQETKFKTSSGFMNSVFTKAKFKRKLMQSNEHSYQGLLII